MVRALSWNICNEMRNLRGKTSFSRKLIIVLNIKSPSMGNVQSAAGSRRWNAQMCPRLGPSLSGIYAFRKQRFFSKRWKIMPIMRSSDGGFMLNARVFLLRDLLGGILKIEIYTGDCAMSPCLKRVYQFGIGNTY